MNYDQENLLRLVTLPYMQLLRPNTALVLLKREVAKLEAWDHFLPQYRTIVCEPLGFAYRYLLCLGALDAPLLQDLIGLWYRGIVMGSWLVALEPRREFRELLVDARPKAPKNQWVVDLAIAAIDGTKPPEIAEHLRLISRIREVLAPIPRPASKLRRLGPLEIERKNNLARAEIVRKIYTTQGVDAAHEYLAANPRFKEEAIPFDRSRDESRHAAHPLHIVWSWGMFPPISTEDLMTWRPPAA